MKQHNTYMNVKKYEHIHKDINIKNNVEEALRKNNLEKLAHITRKILERRKEKLEIRIPTHHRSPVHEVEPSGWRTVTHLSIIEL